MLNKQWIMNRSYSPVGRHGDTEFWRSRPEITLSGHLETSSHPVQESPLTNTWRLWLSAFVLLTTVGRLCFLEGSSLNWVGVGLLRTSWTSSIIALLSGVTRTKFYSLFVMTGSHIFGGSCHAPLTPSMTFSSAIPFTCIPLLSHHSHCPPWTDSQA